MLWGILVLITLAFTIPVYLPAGNSVLAGCVLLKVHTVLKQMRDSEGFCLVYIIYIYYSVYHRPEKPKILSLGSSVCTEVTQLTDPIMCTA